MLKHPVCCAPSHPSHSTGHCSPDGSRRGGSCCLFFRCPGFVCQHMSDTTHSHFKPPPAIGTATPAHGAKTPFPPGSPSILVDVSCGPAFSTPNHQNRSKGCHVLGRLPLLCVKCKPMKAPSASQTAIQQGSLSPAFFLLALPAHGDRVKSSLPLLCSSSISPEPLDGVLAAPFFCTGWFFARFVPGPTCCWEMTPETRSCSAHQTSSTRLAGHRLSTTAGPNTTHALVLLRSTPLAPPGLQERVETEHPPSN